VLWRADDIHDYQVAQRTASLAHVVRKEGGRPRAAPAKRRGRNRRTSRPWTIRAARGSSSGQGRKRIHIHTTASRQSYGSVSYSPGWKRGGNQRLDLRKKVRLMWLRPECNGPARSDWITRRLGTGPAGWLNYMAWPAPGACSSWYFRHAGLMRRPGAPGLAGARAVSASLAD